MVKGRGELLKYSSQIEDLNSSREEQLERRNVELFFSFDIVNSSAYKTINFTGWSQVIISLFNRIQQMVVKTLPGAEMWRIIGDEVVFIIPIKEEKDIFIYIDNIFEILNILIYELKSGEFFETLPFSAEERQMMKLQNIISLKSAAWLAIVGEKLTRMKPYDNILERYKLQDGYGIFEFLGNDIDTGFRIKEIASARRLTVSFELAYLLSKEADYLKNLHLITYRSLKGIWQGRLYPILWYHSPKYVEGINFEDSFVYDEKDTSELVSEYFTNKETPILNKNMHEIPDALEKITKDQGLENKFERINSVIKDSQRDIYHLLDPKFLLQLHCVAVCYDKAEERVLIMRRSDSREILPGYWEFGCAKGSLERSLAEQVVKEYKEDFGIEIKVICDPEREDIQPMPLALYEIESESGKDKGFITIAEIIKPYNIETFKGRKHSKVCWIKAEEIDCFQEPAVRDFKRTLRQVFKKVGELKDGKIK